MKILLLVMILFLMEYKSYLEKKREWEIYARPTTADQQLASFCLVCTIFPSTLSLSEFMGLFLVFSLSLTSYLVTYHTRASFVHFIQLKKQYCQSSH